MKISKEQLKEQIRKIIREYLNSEQIFRTSDKRHPSYGMEEPEEEDDVVTFFDTSGNPDKSKNKDRQKRLADMWQAEQDK